MNLAYDTNEEAKLMAHRIIARILKYDADLLARAQEIAKVRELDNSESILTREWKRILCDHPLHEIRRILTGRSERMYWLRSHSPFTVMRVSPLDQEAYRRRKWRKAKRLVQRRYQRREMEAQSGS